MIRTDERNLLEQEAQSLDREFWIRSLSLLTTLITHIKEDVNCREYQTFGLCLFVFNGLNCQRDAILY